MPPTSMRKLNDSSQNGLYYMSKWIYSICVVASDFDTHDIWITSKTPLSGAFTGRQSSEACPLQREKVWTAQFDAEQDVQDVSGKV